MFTNKTAYIYRGRVCPRILRAAGLCVLFCATVFASAVKDKTIVTETPAITSENTGNPVQGPQKSPETSGPQGASAPAGGETGGAVVKAVPEEEAESRHQIHRVWLWQESGDCLWNLAKKYYNDPWQWKQIYLANKYQIDDPRKIFPKQVLIIPPLSETLAEE